MSQHRSHRRARRVIAQIGSGALLVAGAAVIATTVSTPMANAAGQAISTTTNIAAGTGECVRPDGAGADPVNCNAYAVQDDVWLSNLPQNLPEGDYFFAINAPGTQSTPNDGEIGLLSGDSRADRTFHVSALGEITATHLVVNDRIQMKPFITTTNNGGVYVASVCALPSPDPTAPVNGNDCTHDNFKVLQDNPPPVAPALTVSKTAEGSYDNTYTWGIDKSVDDSTLSGVSGSVTANYTVTLSHDGGAISGAEITGSVTVTNPNPVAAVADITDAFSDAGIVCTLTGAGDDVEVAPGDTVLPFSCDVADDAVPADGLTNTVTVEWDVQLLGDAVLDAGSATDTTDPIEITENTIDECVDVTDTYAGDLGTVCVGDADLTLEYSRTWNLTNPGCVVYPNTASFVTNDGGLTGEDSQNVEVCKTPLNTGAHTIGGWTNKNGQDLIKNGPFTTISNVKVCNSGTYLRTFAPFQDLAANATCAQVATYVTGVINKATATTMTPMLKAQMLATALSVYFTGPGSTLATQKYIPNTNLGAIDIDLTHIKGRDVRAAFNNQTHMTVSQMLSWTAGQYVSMSNWYGTSRPLQTDAKDAFDAINNNMVFAP
ncbi:MULTISPECIES: hypothetical protein [unclassified Nocardioides]|uniref:hypothetical protein n=1 Tax=unclassified Nocardioides TaxID=2615069 RepID=UPI0006F48AA8|nr:MULTISPECIES: hypothetical protein [unclassified Nocardioides]KRA31164.1 hypothetical protein ASD81_16955 [Nocardioides sp. Root614]KRA87784.1 hypothetical protein ASD84_17225 [Nocardioides sp. Root682]